MLELTSLSDSSSLDEHTAPVRTAVHHSELQQWSNTPWWYTQAFMKGR